MSDKVCDEIVCHCNMKENAELIAKIMDYDVESKVCTDVVEIVRCKDCIKYKPFENENYPCGECGNCGYDVPPRIVQEDGFCNEAERKETE